MVIVKLSIIFLLCFLSFCLGNMRAQTKIITKEIEVIKYVDQKKAQIHSRPNANRDALLSLMRKGEL
ncbi:MAG: hypothetical protein E7019_06285 [Alphaproteobacteria bacterium]|nr:hypothetical protein [Alphaproteobacteria bacterium]